MRYYSFQISAFKNERDFFLFFFKEYISNCALGYKKVLLYENVEIVNQSNMAFLSILPKKRHKKVAAVPYCSVLISASKNGNELNLDFF